MTTRPLHLTESSITLEALPFFSHHGVLPHERRDGAHYLLTLTLYFPADRAMQSDSVADTISYAEVYRVLSEEMSQPSALLEHVVYRILKRLGGEFGLLTRATCSLTKLHPPIPRFDGAGATFSATVTYE